MNSTHVVEVVEVKLEKHPHADTLSLVRVADYVCAVRTTDWKDGQLAAYIPPDNVVDTTRAEFAFLGKHPRIRAKKLCGIISYGLLVPAPVGANLGDNVATTLGVTHWEPNIPGDGPTSGDAASPPKGFYPKYDVESFLKYGRQIFIEGEPVLVSEKLHGSSSRYVYRDEVMFYGSRTEWKKEYSSPPVWTFDGLLKQFNGDKQKALLAENKLKNWTPKRSSWWNAADNTPAVAEFCEMNPGYTLYGEMIGHVGGYPYGSKQKGDVRFAAFDILCPTGKWLDVDHFLQMCEKYGIPTVPILAVNRSFNFEELLNMATGQSQLDNHIREGIVVKTMIERWNDKVGRCQLKIINPEYLF